MKKILITAPVHQDIKIFKEYLWSLDRLEIPEGYEKVEGSELVQYRYREKCGK